MKKIFTITAITILFFAICTGVQAQNSGNRQMGKKGQVNFTAQVNNSNGYGRNDNANYYGKTTINKGYDRSAQQMNDDRGRDYGYGKVSEERYYQQDRDDRRSKERRGHDDRYKRGDDDGYRRNW